jgi:hypothetical protein
MIENVKIWIGEKNGEYSRKVQEYLFSQGIEWVAGSNVVHNTERLNIFVDSRQKFISGNYNATEFKNSSRKEMKLIENVTYTLEEVKQREKICIGDKSYYIDELEVALKNIKPI